LLGSVVAPLGASPLVRWRPRPGRPGGPALWRPGDALALVLIVMLVSGTLLATGGAGQGITAAWSGLPATVPAGGPTATAAAQAGGGRNPRGQAGAREVSTVIAPRKVAGPARGSSGQLAAIATATATAASGQVAPPPPTQPAQPAPPTPTPEPPGSALGAAPPPVDIRAATPGAASGYLRDGEFYSRALGRTMPYGIYLPPGYDAGVRTYPILYMLHGGGGHYSEWVEYGLPEIADRLIQQGRIPPLIIVLPQGDHGYWVNHAGADTERWGDYLAEDLVAHIDSTYRTIAEPAGRAIGGLSMGGFGALSLAFTHPDVFGTVGAHSPALRFWEDSPEFLGDEEHYATIDPVELARTLDPARAPRIWLDVGEEDRWGKRIVALHEILAARGVAHEYQLTPGDHDAAYWSGHVDDYLRFYTSSFQRFARPGG
jgi:enterochelin esterase-like enzyme